MDQPRNEVAKTAGFLSQAKAEGMTEADLDRLDTILSADPETGDLIVGSGGCRKVRFAGRGKGKSGGYRVVTYFVAAREMPVYLIAVLSKGSRANFSAQEIAAMAVFTEKIAARADPSKLRQGPR